MANDFSSPSPTNGAVCVALWDMESGALLVDDIQGPTTNLLTDNNTVTNDTTNMKVGTGCGSFDIANTESLSITDASLDSSFPLKNLGDGTFSLTFWFKAGSQSDPRALVTKADLTLEKYSLVIRDNANKIEWFHGKNTGTAFNTVFSSASSLVVGRWYHVGATFDNSTATPAWKFRVWGVTEDALVVDESGNAAKVMSVTTAPFAIGAQYDNGVPVVWYDGLIDEVAFFDDILTTGEIDEIRDETYGSGTSISLFMHHYTKNLRA